MDLNYESLEGKKRIIFDKQENLTVHEDSNIIVKRKHVKTRERFSIMENSDRREQECYNEKHFKVLSNDNQATKSMQNNGTTKRTSTRTKEAFLDNTSKNHQQFEHFHDTKKRAFDNEGIKFKQRHSNLSRMGCKSNNNLNAFTPNSPTRTEVLVEGLQSHKVIAGEQYSKFHDVVPTSSRHLYNESMVLGRKTSTTSLHIPIACETAMDCGAFGDHESENKIHLKGNVNDLLKEIKEFVKNCSLTEANEHTVNCYHVCSNPVHFFNPCCGSKRAEHFCNCPQHIENQRQTLAKHCNCCCQCNRRLSRSLESSRRKCTDLKTNDFYFRRSESIYPSPDKIKKEKYHKAQQNRTTQFKDRQIRKEHKQYRRRDLGEKSHKHMGENKESKDEKKSKRNYTENTDNKTASDFAARFDKCIIETLGSDIVSKLVHIINHYANEEEKRLDNIKNKVAQETFDDFVKNHAGSFNVARKRRMFEITKKNQKPTKNYKDSSYSPKMKSHACYTVDSLGETQYSQETLRMLKKMAIKEYKPIKLKNKDEVGITTEKRETDGRHCTDAKHGKAESYNEYVRKYKSQNVHEIVESDQQQTASDQTYTKDIGDIFEEQIYTCDTAPSLATRGWADYPFQSHDDFEVIRRRNNKFAYKSSGTEQEGKRKVLENVPLPSARSRKSEGIEDKKDQFSYRSSKGKSSTGKSLDGNKKFQNRSEKCQENQGNAGNKKNLYDETMKQSELVVVSIENQRYINEQDCYKVENLKENNSRPRSFKANEIHENYNQHKKTPGSYRTNYIRGITDQVKTGLLYIVPPSNERIGHDRKSKETPTREYFSNNRDQITDHGGYYGYEPEMTKKSTHEEARNKKSVEEEKHQYEVEKVLVKEGNQDGKEVKNLRVEFNNNQPQEDDCHKFLIPFYDSYQKNTAKKHECGKGKERQNLILNGDISVNGTQGRRNVQRSDKELLTLTYTKGSLEDNNLNELAHDLMTTLDNWKCSNNETHIRLFQDKSTSFILQEKETAETQYSEQEDFVATKSGEKLDQNYINNIAATKTDDNSTETKDITTSSESKISHLPELHKVIVAQDIEYKTIPEQSGICHQVVVGDRNKVLQEVSSNINTYESPFETVSDHNKNSQQAVDDSELYAKQSGFTISADLISDSTYHFLNNTGTGRVNIALPTSEKIIEDNLNITGKEDQQFSGRESPGPTLQYTQNEAISEAMYEYCKLKNECSNADARDCVDSYNKNNALIPTEVQYKSSADETPTIKNLSGIDEDKFHDQAFTTHYANQENKYYDSKSIDVPMKKSGWWLMSEDSADDDSPNFQNETYQSEELVNYRCMNHQLPQQCEIDKSYYLDEDHEYLHEDVNFSLSQIKDNQNKLLESNDLNPECKQYEILKRTIHPHKNLQLNFCLDDLPDFPQCPCMFGAYLEMLEIYYQDARKSTNSTFLSF